jgi:hypothetical protein
MLFFWFTFVKFWLTGSALLDVLFLKKFLTLISVDAVLAVKYQFYNQLIHILFSNLLKKEIVWYCQATENQPFMFWKVDKVPQSTILVLISIGLIIIV